MVLNLTLDIKFRPPKKFSQCQRRWLLFAGALLILVGGCTSPSASTLADQPPQEEKREPKSDLVKNMEESLPPSVSHESQDIKESPLPMASQDETNGSVAKGERVYQEHCANCHGTGGDGQGPVAADLSTRPQNFTKGVYKFRSTPSGELPTDEDLLRTISVGIPGTAMESYKDLPQSDLLPLVAYLKSLSPRFLKRQQGTPIIFPSARPLTEQSVTRGSHLYQQMHCAACHGAEGRGDGELAQELADTAGDPIRPADLTRAKLKSGHGPKAIYRTIMTGLDGTPMPSYGDSLDPEEGWELALYIFSIATPKET